MVTERELRKFAARRKMSLEKVFHVNEVVLHTKQNRHITVLQNIN